MSTCCYLCENAYTNPELTSGIDLSFYTIGKCEPGFRILFETGGGRPTAIIFEVQKADVMQTVGYYCPRFCPNCGRELAENKKKKED